jgi:energy-converting hydrogenase A subunit M
MGLEDSLARYGFAWLSLGLVDWTTLTFSPTIAEYVMFNNNKLLDSYKARWKQVHGIKDCFIEVDQLAGVLEKSAKKKSSRAMHSIFEHFHFLCIRAYRQDVWNSLKLMMVFADEDDQLRCLNGDVPLNHITIQKRRHPTKFAWYFPQPSNRHNYNTMDIVERTWFFDDGEERVWGKNRPFRLLFQRCYKVVVRSCGQQEAEKWKKQFPAVFLKFTFTFPQPDKYSFLVRNSKQQGSPFGFHTSVHQQVEDGVERRNIDWLKRSMWSTGSDKRYMKVNTAKLPQQTVAETIKRAEGAMTGRQ